MKPLFFSCLLFCLMPFAVWAQCSVLPTSGTLTCTTPTIELTATAASCTSGGCTYLWDLPGTATATTEKVTADVEGSYSVTITLPDMATCTGSSNITETPGPTPAITSSNAAMCSGDTRTLTGTPAGGTFSVASGPGAISGNTITAIGPGTIQLNYTVFVNGCTGSTTQSITVHPRPAPTINSPPTPMCDGDTRTLTGTPTGGQFSIVSGPGNISGNTLAATGPGTVQISYTITNANNCTGTSQIQSITVHPRPVPTITSSNAAMCKDDTRALSASPVGGFFAIVSGPGSMSGNVLTANSPGIVQISYTVNFNGCTGTSLESITVNDCTIGTDQPRPDNPPGLLLSPNPTAGLLRITSRSGAPLEGPLRVFDGKGRLVRTVVLPRGGATAWSLDAGDLPAGVYGVSVLVAGKWAFGRFVLE